MIRILFILLLFPLLPWSQEKTNMETNFAIGETVISIYKNQIKTNSPIVFVNVHEDENTSIEALHAYSKIDSLYFFYLKHKGTRRISFQMKTKTFDFDPNRIFTKKGRKITLKDGANYSLKANKAVKKLAKEIINQIPQGHTVVAVHNNTDVNYSIKSYLPKGDEAQNTAKIHINPSIDPDDFIYTTNLKFFNAFKAKNINVILQDNKGYVNDGSLSVYCGKNEIPYINIETQKGHFDQQIELIKVVLEVIKETSVKK